MYTLFLATCIVACLIIAGYVIHEVIADKWAAYQDGAREHVGWADVKALPETTVFEPRQPLERRRLASVPVKPDLTLVPDPPADDAWLEDLLREDPLQIPQQRRPGDAS